MTTKIHWLVSGQVITGHKNGTEHTKKLNVLLLTDAAQVTRMDLARAQEGLQQRFVNECVQIPGFRITDAYIGCITLLGQMTPEQFGAGFNQEVRDTGGMN